MINEYDLFEAMNGAKDADLLHAERKAKNRAPAAIVRAVALAACACIVIIAAGVGIFAPQREALPQPQPEASMAATSDAEEAPAEEDFGEERVQEAKAPVIIWNEANYDAPEEELAFPDGTLPFSYRPVTVEEMTTILGENTRSVIGGEDAICQAIYTAGGELFEVELGFAEGTYVLDLYLVEPVTVRHPPLTDTPSTIAGTDFVCWLVEDGKQFGEVTTLTLLARGKLGGVELTAVQRNVDPDQFSAAEDHFAAVLQALAQQGEPNLSFLGYVNLSIHWNQTSQDVPLTVTSTYDGNTRSRFLTQAERDLLLAPSSPLELVRGQAQYTLDGQFLDLKLYAYGSDTMPLDAVGLPEEGSPVVTIDLLNSFDAKYQPDSRELSLLNGQEVLLWRHQREETEAIYHHLFASAQVDGKPVNFEIHFSQALAQDTALLDVYKTYFLNAVAAYLTHGSAEYSSIAASPDTALAWSVTDPDWPMIDRTQPEGSTIRNLSPEQSELFLRDMPGCVTALRDSSAIYDADSQLLSLALSLSLEGVDQELIFIYGDYYAPASHPKEKILFPMGDTEVSCWFHNTIENGQPADKYNFFAALEGRKEYLLIADFPGEQYSQVEAMFAEVLNALARTTQNRDYVNFPTFSGAISTPILDRFIQHMDAFTDESGNENQMDEYFIQLEAGGAGFEQEPTFGPQGYILSQAFGSGGAFGGDGEPSREERRQEILAVRQDLPGIQFVMEKVGEYQAPQAYPTFSPSEVTESLLTAQTTYQDGVPVIQLSIRLPHSPGPDLLLTVHSYDCLPGDLHTILATVLDL